MEESNMMNMEETTSVSPHIKGNPTVRKTYCSDHKDVCIKRSKLRSKPVMVPCWKCLEESKVRLEENVRAAEERAEVLNRALQAEKERAVITERKAIFLEEEQDGLHRQIAKLITQIAGISEELATVLNTNKKLEMRLAAAQMALTDSESGVSSSSPAAAAVNEGGRRESPSPEVITSAGGQAGPSPLSSSSNSTSKKFAAKAAAAFQPLYILKTSAQVTQQQQQQQQQQQAASVAPAAPTLPDIVSEGGESSSQQPPVPPVGSPTKAAAASATSSAAAVSEEQPPSPSATAVAPLTKPMLDTLPASTSERSSSKDNATTGRLEPLALNDDASTVQPPSSPLPRVFAGGRSEVVPEADDAATGAPVVNGDLAGGKRKKRFYINMFKKGGGVAAKKGKGDKSGKDKVEKKKSKGAAAKQGQVAGSKNGAAAQERPIDSLDEPLPIDVLATKLLRLVETEPESLLVVYRKSEQLEEWRMEVQMDLRLQGVFKEEEKAEDIDTASIFTERGSQSSHLSRSASYIFEEQMELVSALVARIKTTVLLNVADCFMLAKEKPDVLRQTTEVVHLHQEFQQRKLASARQKVLENGESLDTVLRLCGIEDWDADVRRTLKEAAALRSLEVFSMAHIEAAGGSDADEGLNREQAMLGAARSLIADLKNILMVVPPFFSPDHRAASIILGQYDAHITRQIQVLHEHGLGDMELGDLFEINRFLIYYQKEIVKLGAQQPRPELQMAAKACLQECLVKTRHQMTDWYTTILARKADVLFDSDGRPFTSTPEDIFQIVHTQVQVGIEAGGFENDELCSLLVVILNVLKAFVAEQYISLHAARKTDDNIEVSVLCATVNDYDRLQDKVTELRDELLNRGKLQHDPHFALIDNVMDQFNDEQTRVSFEAARLISFQVLRDATSSLLTRSPFDSPNRPSVVNPSSLSNGTAAAAAMNLGGLLNNGSTSSNGNFSKVDVLKEARLTIKDYFGDLQVWLPEYFFAHVVSTCFQCLINLYVVSILRGRSLFEDTDCVAHKMKQEKQTILNDFEPYKQQLEETGITDLLVPFGPLDDLIEVVVKGGEVKRPWTGYLLRTLPPPWNIAAVLHLRALRGEVLDRKARQDARAKLTEWYAKELAANSKKAGSSRGGEELKQRLSARLLAWKVHVSPLLEATKDTLPLVRDCVFNA